MPKLYVNICRYSTEMVSLVRLVLLLVLIHNVIASRPCDSCPSCNTEHNTSLLDRCNYAINSCHGKRSADVTLKKRSFFFFKDLFKSILIPHLTNQKRNEASGN
ncbi:hypothetical protein Bpfe_003591 [Biomphalaria pfeifferi]|uniref:LRRNT domain-containing protein n=1 Tax=Biomphalaria pfeifferi TaxID=112525 RepID=A0AAD8C5Q1_BIOPF|nr:hypothetical protein Bpfe_003591 [Biomphalaria pfeifferi]